MCSENCRIENELLEQKNAKEKLQGDNELLKLKLERLQNKYQRLKDEKNEISRKNILMEVKLTSSLAELQNMNVTMQFSIKMFIDAQCQNGSPSHSYVYCLYIFVHLRM